MTQPAGEIATDIPCRRCGYNLRGLAESGRCPECGAAVGLSTRGDLLRFADPNWLGRLKVGLWLMFLGVLCVIVMQLQNFVFSVRLPYPIQPFIYFGFGLITITGAWLLTSPDPAGLAEDQYVTARTLIRIAAAIELTFWIVSLGAQSRSVSPTMRVLLSVLSFVVAIVVIAGDIAKFSYIAKLAGRAPANGIVRFLCQLMWCYPIVQAPYILFAIVFAFVQTSVAPLLGDFFRWHRYLNLAVLMALAILYVRMARLVRRQENVARRSEAAAEGAVSV